MLPACAGSCFYEEIVFKGFLGSKGFCSAKEL